MTDVLLVDDDVNLVKSLAGTLNADGFSVSACTNAADALMNLELQEPEIAILDVSMPDMNGIDLMAKIREKSEVPVLFLSGRDDEVDQILALRLGADDYVCKPCSGRLVGERIRTILRRKTIEKDAMGAAQAQKTGDLVIDESRHNVHWKDRPLNLTGSEYLLLRALTEERDCVKTRDALIECVQDPHKHVDHRTIDTHIKRLRKKFRDVDPEFEAIKTIYGVGYKFALA